MPHEKAIERNKERQWYVLTWKKPLTMRTGRCCGVYILREVWDLGVLGEGIKTDACKLLGMCGSTRWHFQTSFKWSKGQDIVQ